MFTNPSFEACEAAARGKATTIIPDEAIIIGSFLAQLRLLLGIPEMVIHLEIQTICQLNDKNISFIISEAYKQRNRSTTGWIEIT